jgi:hypothetical protein
LLFLCWRCPSSFWRRQPVVDSPRPTPPPCSRWDNGTLAGAVTLVADKDKVLSVDTVGFADIAAKLAMRADALFWIASKSVSITATGLMVLVDDGKVQLDHPVENSDRQRQPMPTGGLVSMADGRLCQTILNKGVARAGCCCRRRGEGDGKAAKTRMASRRVMALALRQAESLVTAAPSQRT